MDITTVLFTKKCSTLECDRVIKYDTERKYKWAVDHNSVCKRCRKRWLRLNSETYRRGRKGQAARRSQRRRSGNLRLQFQMKVTRIRVRALQKGIPFDLTPDYIQQLYNEQGGKCYYSGVPMQVKTDDPDMTNKYPNILSVDRKDSSKGYVKGNIVLCTFAANSAKGILSEKEFFKLAGKIYRVGLKRQPSRHLSCQNGENHDMVS